MGSNKIKRKQFLQMNSKMLYGILSHFKHSDTAQHMSYIYMYINLSLKKSFEPYKPPAHEL